MSDDPIFDPWTVEREGAPSAAQPRWRSPQGADAVVARPSRPLGEAARVSPTAPPAAEAPRQRRLAGTAGFLRTMAEPRLRNVAARLQAARHRARVEDHLESSSPCLRLHLLPWGTPMIGGTEPREGVLEIAIDFASPQQDVRARAWLLPDGEALGAEQQIAVARIGAAWLETRVMQFVERMLALG